MEAKRVDSKFRIVESSKEWTPKYLDISAVVFVTALLVSNLAAQKMFMIFGVNFTAGILVFPISYIFGDILTEVYGFNRARRVIYSGLIANFFMAGVLFIAIKLPPAPGWNLQHEFETVHSMIPRIVLASAMGYLFGELTNSFVLSKMKILTKGKMLWTRTISSTIAGQFVDSGVFAIIGFFGIIPFNLLISIAISAWLFKSAYEALATPLTYFVVKKIKSAEGIEHFDSKEKIRLI